MFKALINWINQYAIRKKELRNLAKEMNLTFSEKDEFGLINLLKDFQLFKTGGRKKVYNILREESDFHQTDIRVFDYKYTISTGKSSKTYRQTVFFMQSKRLDLPQFFMKPEHFFHRIGKFLGFDDIDFEEFPQFSQQYWLKGESESRIRESMNEELLHFFTIEKNWSLEGINYYLIFYKKSQLLAREKIKDFHEKGKKIVEMFYLA